MKKAKYESDKKNIDRIADSITKSNNLFEWKYAKRSLTSMPWDYYISTYADIYIYGAGVVGKLTFLYLKYNISSIKVEAFIETNRSKETYCGTRVITVDEISNLGERSIVFAAALNGKRKEIIDQCNKMGIKNVVPIIAFDQRNYEYYAELPEEYYQIELEGWYERNTGRYIDINNPVTFNEKIQWFKLHDRSPLKTLLVDKYRCRKWVAQRIGEDYLIPLLGVWNDAADIDFEELPEKFVLKCNHGCGYNILVNDKYGINRRELVEKINSWIKTNYAFVCGFELQYKDVLPVVMAEKMLELNEYNDLPDYKFFCFEGRVFCSYVMKDYHKNHTTGVLGFFDREFNRIPYYRLDYKHMEQSPDKPLNYDKMIEIAERLSKGFAHVRVDLYNIMGKIYFGEMTFSTASGVGFFEPEEFDYILGEQLKIHM